MSASTEDESADIMDIKEEYLGEQQNTQPVQDQATPTQRSGPPDPQKTSEEKTKEPAFDTDPLILLNDETSKSSVTKTEVLESADGEEEYLLQEQKSVLKTEPKRSTSKTKNNPKKKRGRPKKNKSTNDETETDESRDSIPIENVHISEVEVTFDGNGKNEEEKPTKRQTRKRNSTNPTNGYLGNSSDDDVDSNLTDEEYVPKENSKKKKRNDSHTSHNENSCSSDPLADSAPKISVAKNLTAKPSSSDSNPLGLIKIASVSGAPFNTSEFSPGHFSPSKAAKTPDSLTENEARSCNRLVANYLKAFLKLSKKMTDDFQEILDKLPDISTKTQFKNMTETIHSIARDGHNEIQITMAGMKRRCRTTLEDDNYVQKTANAKNLLNKVQMNGISWTKKVVPKVNESFTGVNVLDERVIMNKDITIKKVKNAPAFPYSYMNFNM